MIIATFPDRCLIHGLFPAFFAEMAALSCSRRIIAASNLAPRANKNLFD